MSVGRANAFAITILCASTRPGVAAEASQAADRERPTAPEPPAPLPVPVMRPPTRPVVVVDDPLRGTAVYYVFGFGAPTGVAGLEGVHRFGELFEISAGVGIGGSAAQSEDHPPLSHSAQWSVMPRAMYGDRHHLYTFGAGVSGGQYGGIQLFGMGIPGCVENQPCHYPTRYVLWMNFELGVERWWAGGFALRYFAGYAHGCTTDSCMTSINGDQLSFPYLGVGLGYAF